MLNQLLKILTAISAISSLSFAKISKHLKWSLVTYSLIKSKILS
jgi:hypothetical protein